MLFGINSNLDSAKMMNPLTIGDANGSSSHMNNLMVLYYLVYALDKKECSLTLHSTSSPTKKPLEWTVAAKDIYSQYNIKAHNQSHATIQKKKRRFALSTHQIFFVSLQALKACIQPPKLLSSNRTNGLYIFDFSQKYSFSQIKKLQN